jgi:hypothetical protein
LLFAIALGGGCRRKRGPTVPTQFERERAELMRWRVEETISPLCGTKANAPAIRAISRGGNSYTQACGTIVTEIDAPEYRAQFVEQVCAGQPDERCLEKYRDMSWRECSSATRAPISSKCL